MLFKLFFPVLFVACIYFLIRSIGWIIQVYGGPKIEFPARTNVQTVQIDKAGQYEIAYKRPSITGVIPSDVTFELSQEESGKSVAVSGNVNLIGMRKDMSGHRIMPVASFHADQPGAFRLRITESVRYKDGDKLLITATTGANGFLAIIAIVFSAIGTIASLVLSILGWMNKL